MRTPPAYELTNEAIRNGLGWVRQDDNVNCGPFSVAAVILILAGLAPSACNLGLQSGRDYTAASATLLRDSILMLFLEEVWEHIKERSIMGDGSKNGSLLGSRVVLHEFDVWKTVYAGYTRACKPALSTDK